MTTFVLYVTLLGLPPQEVRRYPTYKQCKHEKALVFEVSKISTTVYECKEERSP